MANRKIWLRILVIMLVFVMTVVGCGGGLNGTWVHTEGWIDAEGTLEFDFNNGSFKLIQNGRTATEGTYKTNGNNLLLTPKGQTETVAYSYSLNGNTLSIDINGNNNTFTKKTRK